MVDHPREPNASGRPRQGRSSDTTETEGGERVAKALARAGVASRRDVERLIAERRVALNGQVLDTPAVKIGPGDILTVDGEVVAEREPARLWRYHKPSGLVTTNRDPQGRPTVFDALPKGLPRVITVGRLDLATEGLLLLTNDGELARALELPATGWIRRYRARAFGRITQDRLDKLKDGVTVEGVAYGPIEARLDKVQHKAGETREGPANVWISVAIAEGKNREVRRVLESLGLKVNRLLRLAYGPFALGTLPVGAVEEVGPRVIREQLAGFIPPENLPRGSQPQTGLQLAPRGVGGSAAGERAERPRRPPPAASSEEAPAKKVYKTGWAKPKAGKSPHPSKPNASKRPRPGGEDRAEGMSYRASFGPRPNRSGGSAPAGGGESGAGKPGKGVKPARPAGALGRIVNKRPKDGPAQAAKPHRGRGPRDTGPKRQG